MKTSIQYAFAIATIATAGLVGCSSSATKAPDVSDVVRKSLNDAGFHNVSASDDRDKGVVTLSGHVEAEADKARAGSLAMSVAGNQVVSNQIAVVPPGLESEARKVNSDLDKGIESNLDAALIGENFHDHVKYSVKNRVVTLTGELDSQDKRGRVEAVAAGVPNVQQVVNEVQIKSLKATTSR